MVRLALYSSLFCIFLLGSIQNPSAQTNLYLLRDIICSWETRNLSETKRDDYIGTHGEIGRCASTVSTLRLVGYKGTNKALLNLPWLARHWALEIIEWCADRKGDFPYFIARCYNGGPNSKSKKSHRYARQIAADYAMIDLLWQRRN